jgi:hypothetical protein
MMTMENNFENLENRFRSYRETPSEKSWSRLERRLNQDRGKIESSKVIFYSSIAASMILLISFMIWIFNYSGNDDFIYQEELSMSYGAEFTVYQHAPEINGWYLIHDWSSIYEGDVNKNLKVTANPVLLNDQVPSQLSVDDDSLTH